NESLHNQAGLTGPHEPEYSWGCNHHARASIDWRESRQSAYAGNPPLREPEWQCKSNTAPAAATRKMMCRQRPLRLSLAARLTAGASSPAGSQTERHDCLPTHRAAAWPSSFHAAAEPQTCREYVYHDLQIRNQEPQ